MRKDFDYHELVKNDFEIQEELDREDAGLEANQSERRLTKLIKRKGKKIKAEPSEAPSDDIGFLDENSKDSD